MSLRYSTASTASEVWGSLFSEVEPNVGVGQGDGPLRGVDRAYFACPARKSIYRKSARVAEGIEDRASSGVAAYQFAVEALVDKEARFLPLFPIDQEFFAVFEHGAGHSSRFAVKVPVHGIQAGLERYGLGTFVVDGGNPVAVNRSDRIGDCQAGVVHAHRVTLNHGGRVVNIDDESRQGVPLAVNQTVAGGVGGIREPERAAHVECGGDHPLPPGRVDRFLFEGEHPHGDRTDLVMSPGDEVARTGIDIDEGHLRGFRFRRNGRIRSRPRKSRDGGAATTLPCRVGRCICGIISSFSLVWVCAAAGRRYACRPRRPLRRRTAACR